MEHTVQDTTRQPHLPPSSFRLCARDYLDSPEHKRHFNALLFREVAPRYDLITRLLSFGRDSAWKRAMVKRLPAAATQALDIACGTGDLTRALAHRYPNAQIIGLDLTPEMLDRARARGSPPGVRFIEGNMQALPFPDNTFDVVTGGYALRNAPDLDAALREIHRVLRPGGTLAVLDFSRSPTPLASRLQYALLKCWGGMWGLLLHRHADVYGYIAESLQTFPDRPALRARLRASGFTPVRFQTCMLGMLELSLHHKESLAA